MKILLTGGLGFMGKNFILHRPQDWQIVSLDLIEDKKFQKLIKNCQFFQVNLSDENQVKKLSKKLPDFDACLHLAANGDPALSVPDPLWDLKSTTETLINVGTNFKIKKLIYLSSGAVYDGNQGLISPKSKIDPTLPYAISHFAAEQYVRFFQKNGIIKSYVILRFFGAYGPYEPPRKIYTNLVKDFALAKKKEFTLKGNGKNYIDAMFVEDAVKALMATIKSRRANFTLDLCWGKHPSLNSLVEQAAQIFGVTVKIKHLGVVPEYNQFYASPKEFERQFGFKPAISLEKGLSKLKEYLEKNLL